MFAYFIENSNVVEPERFPNQNMEQVNQEVRQEWWGCWDCKRILDSPHLATVTSPPDSPERFSLTDIERYVHDILEEDDKETMEAKEAFNQALFTI